VTDDEATDLAETRFETRKLKDRYRIERRLGHGGLGVVYLARDEALHDRPVVIKMPLANSSANPWIEEKFAQEVKALAVIDHPGVVGALDSGVTPTGQPFLVMQYVDGQSLQAVVTSEGMPLDAAARIVEQIGHALAAAHARNIFHRDLKPANIMLQRSADGHEYVRLIDFGIASVRESLTQGETHTTVAGTLQYMAPEQFEGRVSAATDIYALAVVAYELTTGSKPFVGNNPISLVRLQQAGARPPSQLRPQMTAEAERLILQGLAFDPRERPKGAAAFGDALGRALTQPIDSPRPTTERLSSAEIAPVVPTSRLPFILTAAVAVALIAAAGIVWSRVRPQTVAQVAPPPRPQAEIRAESKPDEPPAESPRTTLEAAPASQPVAPHAVKQDRPALYTGPREGRLVWTGDLQPGQQVDLGSRNTAVAGALPGVPVSIEVHPASVTVVTPPSASNDWRSLVVRNDGKKQVVVLVNWTVTTGRGTR
jgi:serine/threonine-protein kinase